MALAEATAATWDLARSASEPAARISRQVLDAATGPERNPAQPASVAGSERSRQRFRSRRWIRLPPTRPPRERCCNRSATASPHGVRPLSDTARHAFGFLLGTALAKPEVPVNPPAQKGA